MAFDLPVGKNLLGAFYQPEAVFNDVKLLTSLTKEHWSNGFGEAIKYGVIKDAELFQILKDTAKDDIVSQKELLTTVISRCVQIKAQVVSEDEREQKGIRTILNFGHTIGHALETVGGYERFSHGQAISIGMVCAAQISKLLNLTSLGLLEQIVEVLDAYGLPSAIPADIQLDQLQETIYRDKKFIHGSIRMVLPVAIGEVKVVDDIEPELVVEAMRRHQS